MQNILRVIFEASTLTTVGYGEFSSDFSHHNTGQAVKASDIAIQDHSGRESFAQG